MNRREFAQKMTLATTLGAVPKSIFNQPTAADYPYPISSNFYNWTTFYQREGKQWGKDWDTCMADYAKTGLLACEPSFNEAADVLRLAPFLKKYQIQLPSVYVNSLLHYPAQAEKSIASVLSIAEEVKKLGTKIMVTNPTPLPRGEAEVKSDQELQVQVANLDKLGGELRKRGITLAYHTHDVELKAGAREFHHVLLNTSPQNVAFCFDTHWVYRGSQNSVLAVFDVLKLYGHRIVELHLRQSVNGVWSETFGEGDIDYRRLATELKRLKLQPHLVIEQCVEAKSPHTMGAVEAHIKDVMALKEIFNPILNQ